MRRRDAVGWAQTVTSAVVAAGAATGAVWALGLQAGVDRAQQAALGAQMVTLGAKLGAVGLELREFGEGLAVYRERVDNVQQSQGAHDVECMKLHGESTGRLIRLESETHRHGQPDGSRG